MSWGPQPDGRAALPTDPPRAAGTWLLVPPIVAGVVGFVFGGFLLILFAVLAQRQHTGPLIALSVAVGVVVLLVSLAAAAIGTGNARSATGWF